MHNGFIVPFSFGCIGAFGQTPAKPEKYVRQSAPELLTFDELVQLEKTDDPDPQLAARLDRTTAHSVSQ